MIDPVTAISIATNAFGTIKLVPMLTKEIQSLRNRVAQLKTGE